MVRLKNSPIKSLPADYLNNPVLEQHEQRDFIPNRKFFHKLKAGEVSGLNGNLNDLDYTSSYSTQHKDESMSPDVDSNGNNEDPQYNDPPLTEVQKYMLRAIKGNGGSAPVKVIQEYVAKRWGRMRKRDGSRYTYDYRRVISASLANTSSINPLFERHPTLTGWWKLGMRAKMPEIKEAVDNSSDEEDEADDTDNDTEESTSRTEAQLKPELQSKSEMFEQKTTIEETQTVKAEPMEEETREEEQIDSKKTESEEALQNSEKTGHNTSNDEEDMGIQEEFKEEEINQTSEEPITKKRKYNSQFRNTPAKKLKKEEKITSLHENVGQQLPLKEIIMMAIEENNGMASFATIISYATKLKGSAGYSEDLDQNVERCLVSNYFSESKSGGCFERIEKQEEGTLQVYWKFVRGVISPNPQETSASVIFSPLPPRSARPSNLDERNMLGRKKRVKKSLPKRGNFSN